MAWFSSVSIDVTRQIRQKEIKSYIIDVLGIIHINLCCKYNTAYLI